MDIFLIGFVLWTLIALVSGVLIGSAVTLADNREQPTAADAAERLDVKA